MLLLLLALVQGPAVRSDQHLAAYLTLVSGYAAGERIDGLRKIRTWRSVEIDGALAALRDRGDDLRAVPAGRSDIDFHLVEAAVVLHAEVGLLALQASSPVDAGSHLARSVALFEWSRGAARRLREPPDRLPPAFDIRERIAPRDFYLALAATALFFGHGPAARTYAERAVKASPRDAEVYLVLGCAAEYAANDQVLKKDAAATRRFRREAESALRQALAIDPGLVEAHLRLGHVLLAEGRLTEAEPVLAEAEARAGDGRGRYLARLFLGRAADAPAAAPVTPRSCTAAPSRRGRRRRRPVSRWPTPSRSEGDPSAARAQVAVSLEASRQDDRPADPFWGYRFGPPGAAKAVLDRVFAVIEP